MEQLVNFIIRPPRAQYDPKHDLLHTEFMLKGKWFQRKDIELKNSRGDVLLGSHYFPIGSNEKCLPCVIYCHGNSGCRADACEAAIILLASNITVFALDFSGSGLSGGEHVTLGWNEKDDLRAVVDHLRQDGNVSLIGLWGRSMGAVTSLFYGAEDPSIAGMVLDSPFSNLVDLMMELVETYKIRLPKFTVRFAIQFMRKAIQRKAKFDIMDLDAIKVAKSCFVPVLFGHAVDDDFICPHHSDRIFEAYMGDKNIIKFEGDHNSPRPQFYFDSINIFFHNVLQPPQDEAGSSLMDDSHLESLLSAHDTSPSSTTDMLQRVCPRRPISRIEVPSHVSSDGKQSGFEGGETEDSRTSPTSSSKMISFDLSDGHLYDPEFMLVDDDDDDDDGQYVEYKFDETANFPCDAEEEEEMFLQAVMESLKDLKVQHQQLPQEHCSVQEDASSSAMEASSSPSPDVPGFKTEAQSVTTTATLSSQNDADRDLPGNTKATLMSEKKANSNVTDETACSWDL